MNELRKISCVIIAMSLMMVSQLSVAAVMRTQTVIAPQTTSAPETAPAGDIEIAGEDSSKSTTMSSTLPDPVGRVLWIKGNFIAVMPNNEKRELQKTSLIYLHDTLITDANTQAQIVFTDNSLMTFKPDTKFYIDQYLYQPQKKKGSVGTYIMQLTEGGFRTITGLIPKANPDDYKVNTPVATIGVRGTDYAVYYKDGELNIGYYKGTPCVNNEKGNLCLSSSVPYAKASSNAAPVPLSQQPVVFQEKLEILPATIAPFGSSGGGDGGTGGTGGAGGTSDGGTVSSFCIQ